MNAPTTARATTKQLHSVGFPRSVRASVGVTAAAQQPTSHAASTTPTSLRQPPKGRLFVGSILLTLVLSVSFTIWNEFFRFQAFGLVTGDIVSLSSPQMLRDAIDGSAWSNCRAGQVIAEIDLPELRFERNKAERELQLATSNLHLRIAELETRTRETECSRL